MTARLRPVEDPGDGRGLPCWAMRLDAVSGGLSVERSQAERVPVGGCAGWE